MAQNKRKRTPSTPSTTASPSITNCLWGRWSPTIPVVVAALRQLGDLLVGGVARTPGTGAIPGQNKEARHCGRATLDDIHRRWGASVFRVLRRLVTSLGLRSGYKQSGSDRARRRS